MTNIKKAVIAGQQSILSFRFLPAIAGLDPAIHLDFFLSSFFDFCDLTFTLNQCGFVRSVDQAFEPDFEFDTTSSRHHAITIYGFPSSRFIPTPAPKRPAVSPGTASAGECSQSRPGRRTGPPGACRPRTDGSHRLFGRKQPSFSAVSRQKSCPSK